MAYFIRYIGEEADAQSDLERGHSFVEYAFFTSREAAVESDYVQFFNPDLADDIVAFEVRPGSGISIANGGATTVYGFATRGLCGFQIEAESDEEAIAVVARGEHPSYAAATDYIAIYEGRLIGQADGGDGDMFTATRLIAVRNLVTK